MSIPEHFYSDRETALGMSSVPVLKVVANINSDPDIWRITTAIGGMTCASCANSVTEALENRHWIKGVNVNLISMLATVDVIEEGLQKDVVEAIEDLGFEATIINVKLVKTTTSSSDTSIRTVDLLVKGMFANDCPTNVLSSLSTYEDCLKIVKPLSLEDPILTVAYTPNVPTFTIRDIVNTISNASGAIDTPYDVCVNHPPTFEEQAREIHLKEGRRISRRALITFIVAIPTFVIGVVYMSLVPATDTGRRYLEESTRGVSRAQWILFPLATPVYFYCASVFHLRALKEIRAMWRPGSTTPYSQRFFRFGSMNMLMSLGTSIAYFSSIAQLIASASHPSRKSDDSAFYFDSVVFLTLFLLVGRLIEAYSKSKTADAVQMLGKLRPEEALLVESASAIQTVKDDMKGGTGRAESLERVHVDFLEYGDTVQVPYGASPPRDGTVLRGETKFDQSSITGESKLIEKHVGDEVFSGTVNKGSPICIKITGVVGSSMLDQIINAVRDGQTRRAPLERIADSVTSYFVPFVTFLAIGTWIIWLSLGYSGRLPRDYRGENSGGWIAWSSQFAISVFVVACPCGLGLAAPTALFVGGGLAAQHGILVKGGGEAFENASRLDCIVFDKTGTLTVGEEPAVTESLPATLDVFATTKYPVAESRMVVLRMIRAIESNSNHPIARALQTYCNVELVEDVYFEAIAVEELPGKGMAGSFRFPGLGVMHMLLGNETLMADSHVPMPLISESKLGSWKNAGSSIVLAALSFDGRPMRIASLADMTWQLTTMFAISDPIRPESPRIIEQLKSRGLEVYMLSGDNQITANAIGSQVGIPADNIIAGVLPSEKADKIRYLQRSLKSRKGIATGFEHTQKRARIAMVGDGINDSPALTAADVGIAIGSGSDIAVSSAEFVLVTSDLHMLITLLDLSAVVFRRIKLNFAWAALYNVVAMPIAAGAFYSIVSDGTHIRLDPVWASLAMAASSISVVCSSLALKIGIPWIGFKAKEYA